MNAKITSIPEGRKLNSVTHDDQGFIPPPHSYCDGNHAGF